MKFDHQENCIDFHRFLVYFNFSENVTDKIIALFTIKKRNSKNSIYCWSSFSYDF